MRRVAMVAGFVVGMGVVVPGAFAVCFPVNPITKQACITHQGYALGKSYQGNRHKHYFTNTCKQRLQITFEWVDARPQKWSHKVILRGKRNISCLQGACPGAVIWAPVCLDGSVGTSALVHATRAKVAQRRKRTPAPGTPLDRQIIGTWDFKNTHNCPRHTMGCNGRYDFVAKKSTNKYLFHGVISCRRVVKRGVQEKLQSEKTFTSYFDEIWTVKGGRIVSTSTTKSKDKNVSAITLSSILRENTFSGSGLTCHGAGKQNWTATRRP